MRSRRQLTLPRNHWTALRDRHAWRITKESPRMAGRKDVFVLAPGWWRRTQALEERARNQPANLPTTPPRNWKPSPRCYGYFQRFGATVPRTRCDRSDSVVSNRPRTSLMGPKRRVGWIYHGCLWTPNSTPLQEHPSFPLCFSKELRRASVIEVPLLWGYYTCRVRHRRGSVTLVCMTIARMVGVRLSIF